MAVPIPYREPEFFYAGETLKFKLNLSDYDPSSWTITYSLVKDGTQIQFSGTADNGDHLINVDEATTASYATGTYNYVGRVTDGVDVFQARRGQIEIRADFAAASSGSDARTHVKKVLDALEAMIEGKATKDQLSYSIQGRSLSRLSPADVIQFHNHYKSLYQAELAAERVSRDVGSRNKVLVRFG